VISAVFWSCLGGIELGRGITKVLLDRLQYDWITPLLMGWAFLGFGILWAVTLLRRLRLQGDSKATDVH